MPKCPFFPNEFNPCQMHDCQFLCIGGCAISLSAHAYDTLQNTNQLKRETETIKNKLNSIEEDVQRVKRALNQ